MDVLGDTLQFLNDTWWTHRDLVGAGIVSVLDRIEREIPLIRHVVPSGERVWNWEVPLQWTPVSATLRADGKTLIDLREHILHLVVHSQPFQGRVSRAELARHLHTSPGQPAAIPFIYRYYRPEWGFCAAHDTVAAWRHEAYDVQIDTRLEPGSLVVGEHCISGATPDRILIISDICHSGQVNDALSGAAVNLQVAKELRGRRLHYTYSFLFGPETIGSVAYLSRHEHLLPSMQLAIVVSAAGSATNFGLQHSFEEDTLLDDAARRALRKVVGGDFREGKFRKIAGTDEMVYNGPGARVPTISLTRFPFPEYHSSLDNPKALVPAHLQQAVDVMLETIEIIEAEGPKQKRLKPGHAPATPVLSSQPGDFIPRRTFKGPVFLTQYGLWVDWSLGPEALALNRAIDDIMMHLEGDRSVSQIAATVGLRYETARKFIGQLEHFGLVKRV